jgi:hypothetical protein
VTLLVGIRCSDGVVVAADSASTFASGGGQPTITHPQRKIDIIQEQMIIAGTGEVGLGQRFGAVAQALYQGKQLTGTEFDLTRKLCHATITDFKQTYAPQGQFGALVAFINKNKAHLCEFAVKDFQPELKEDKCWYVSMGSGQALADPYLALMRLTFWSDGPPNLEDGIFAAAWVMRHAILVSPMYLREPAHIAVLSTSEKKAYLLSEDEMSEHMNVVDASREHFKGFEKKILESENAAPLPEPEVKS